MDTNNSELSELAKPDFLVQYNSLARMQNIFEKFFTLTEFSCFSGVSKY